MSHEGEEELLDYSDSEDIAVSAPGTTTASATAEAPEAGEDGLTIKQENGDKKGSYVGIHSTGFKDFLLKPELVRAITDSGFEHPSEGMFIFFSVDFVPFFFLLTHPISSTSLYSSVNSWY